MITTNINQFLITNHPKKTYWDLSKLTGLSPEAVRSRLRNMRRSKDIPIASTPESPSGIDCIFLNDIHFPYQDDFTLDNVLKFIADHSPKTIFLNGDIIDFYTLSRFDKDPVRITHLQKDLDALDNFLKKLRQAVPQATIYYTEGNHEHRLIKYLWSHPEIAALKALQIEELLNLKAHTITWIPQEETFVYHGHIITHGTVVRKGASMSAKGEFEKYGFSGISGHTHRAGVYSHRNFRGTFQWIENGCLCDMNPGYVLAPDWQQAISVGTMQDNELAITLIKINNHKITSL